MSGGKFYALALLSVVALAPPTHAQRIEGFGKDVPLAFAVRQIVPNDYLVRFETGIDQNVLVSWSGADEWQSVLGAVTSPRGLSFRLDTQTVIIGTGARVSAAQAAPAPVPQPPSVDRPSSIAAPSSGVVASPSYPAPPLAQAPPKSEEVRTGGLVIRSSRNEPSPAVVNPPSPSPSRPLETSAVRSRAATPGPVTVEGLPPAERASNVSISPPVGSHPSSFGGPSVQAPRRPDVATSGSASASERPAPPQTAAPASNMPVDAGQRAASNGAQPGAATPARRSAVAPEGVRPVPENARSASWRAPKGESLNNVLSDWGEKSGWTVVFQSRVIYELQASAQFDGDFVEAATSLLKSIQANPMPRATFFRGNRVLLVADATN